MVHFINRSSVFLVLSLLLAYGCSNASGDRFLVSLDLPPVVLTPCDSINLEQFNWHMPTGIIKYEDCFVIKTDMRDYCLSLLDGDNEPMDLIRLGRGPGEMVQSPRLQFYDNKVICYDFAAKTLVSVDIGKSKKMGKPVLDTLRTFADLSFWVTKLLMADNCFVADRVPDDNNWYMSMDMDGGVLSGVPAIDFPVVNEMSRAMKASFSGSSLASVAPDGKKVCWASVASATLSFSKIEDGILTEIKRYSYNPPLLAKGGHAFSMDSCNGFESLFSNDDYVFALYSGKPMSSTESPSWECNHLLVYDWTGFPRKYYYLSHPVKSIWVEGDILYATTTYPEAKILLYNLNVS